MFKNCIKYFFTFSLIFGNITYINIEQSAEASPTSYKCMQAEKFKKTIPDCVYRADTRDPNEIFETGFQIPGDGSNNNILDHVAGTSILDNMFAENKQSTTNFVSTTEQRTIAENWLKNSHKEKWLYFIEPDENFFSVNESLEKALEKSELGAELRKRIEVVYEKYKYQLEWSAKTGIPKERIIAAVPYKYDSQTLKNIPDYSRHKVNKHFKATKNKATIQPLPITKITECISREKRAEPFDQTYSIENNACIWRIPQNSQELQDIHLNKFAENLNIDLENISFTTDINLVDGVPGKLMSPLQESTKTLNSFDPSNGVLGYQELQNDLLDSLQQDLHNFNHISKEPIIVAKTVEKHNLKFPTKPLLARAGAMVPYLGIAISGYALYEDLQAKDWNQALLDSFVLGINFALAVEPELAVTIEPAFNQIGILQEVNTLIGKNEMVEIVSKLDTQTEHVLEKWQKLPENLADIALELNKKQILKFVEQVKNEHFLPDLRKSLYKDFTLIDKLEETYVKEINFKALAAVGDNASEEKWQEIDKIRQIALTNLQAKFFTAKQQRTKDYTKLLEENTTSFVKDFISKHWQTGNAGYDSFTENFDEKIVLLHIKNIENILNNNYLDNPNSVPIDYAHKTNIQIRGEKFLEYKKKVAQNLANLAENIFFVTNEAQDIQSLEEDIFLNLENFAVNTAANSAVINIGNSLCLHLNYTGVLHNNDCGTENFNVDKIFEKAGRTKISIYNENKSLHKIYDSVALDLTQTSVRQHFYNQIGSLKEKQFLVFEFENPINFVKLGAEHVFLETRLDNTTKYVTQIVENKFVPWFTNQFFVSENVHTFRIKLENSPNFIALAEDRIRGKIAFAEDEADSLAQNWNFIYDKATGFYIISNAINPNLVLDMDISGRVFMNVFSKNSKFQFWDVRRDQTKLNLISLANGNQLEKPLAVDLDTQQIQTTDISNKPMQNRWVLEATEDKVLLEGKRAIQPAAQLGKALQYDFASDTSAIVEPALAVASGKNLEQFNFAYDNIYKAYIIQHINSQQERFHLTLGDNAPNNVYFTANFVGVEQLWVITRDTTGSFVISNYKYKNMVLTVSLRNSNVFAQTFQENNSEQKWNLLPQNFRPITDGVYRVSSNLGLRYVFDYVKVGNKLEMWGRNSGKNQQWYFEYDKDKQAYRISSIFDRKMFWFWDKTSNSLQLSNKTSEQTWWHINCDNTGLVTFSPYLKDESNLDKILTVLPANEGDLADGSKLILSSVVEKTFYEDNITQKFVLETMEAIPGLTNSLRKIRPVNNLNLLVTMVDNTDDGVVYLAEKDSSLGDNQTILFTYNEQQKAYRINFVKLGKNFMWTGEEATFLVGNHNDDNSANHWWEIVEDLDGNFRITNKAKPYLGVLQPVTESMGAKIGGVFADVNQKQLWSLGAIY